MRSLRPCARSCRELRQVKLSRAASASAMRRGEESAAVVVEGPAIVEQCSSRHPSNGDSLELEMRRVEDTAFSNANSLNYCSASALSAQSRAEQKVNAPLEHTTLVLLCRSLLHVTHLSNTLHVYVYEYK